MAMADVGGGIDWARTGFGGMSLMARTMPSVIEADEFGLRTRIEVLPWRTWDVFIVRSRTG
jgi:hypothetical protein